MCRNGTNTKRSVVYLNHSAGRYALLQPTHNHFLQFFFSEQRQVIDNGYEKNREDSLVYLMPEKQIPLTHRRQRRERTQGSLSGTMHGEQFPFSCLTSNSHTPQKSQHPSLDLWCCHLVYRDLLARPKNQNILKHIALGPQN